MVIAKNLRGLALLAEEDLIDTQRTDSQGNNLLHLAAQVDGEVSYQLITLLKNIKIPLTQKNSDGHYPVNCTDEKTKKALLQPSKGFSLPDKASKTREDEATRART